jgi:hypothetical protein
MRAAVLLLVVACKSAPTQAPPPKPTPSFLVIAIPPVEGPSCDGVDLDVVAACVRKVIAIEQRLPDDDAFGPMFARASTRGLDEVCSTLPGATSGEGLVTAGGQPIVITSTSSSWDHLEDGTAVRYIDYRVSSAGCAETVDFGVENTVGGP